MSVFKKFRGKRITPKDKNWSKGTWYVWKRIAGKIIHRSIPDARTKEQAELAERRYIEQSFNRRFGIASNVPFAEFADGPYTRYVEQHNVNQVAKKHYIALLKKQFKGRSLADVSPQDCRDAQWHLRRKMSDSSVNRVMSTASKLFTLACEEGLLDRNPMQYVKMLKEPEPRKRLLTVEEKEKLWIELEKDPLLANLVRLAVNLPLRRGQLLAITPAAVDFQNGVLFTISSKGRPGRLVPLNTIAENTLRHLINDSQLPFPLKDFRKRWFRALSAAGIQDFRFHDLRREQASELIRQNVNPEVVRKLFAHSDLRITQVYMHSDMDELKAAVKTLENPPQCNELQPSEFSNLPIH